MDIENILKIAQDAGEKILAIYRSGDMSVKTKSDESPLTKADLASHHHICNELEQLYPDIPILSEESAKIDFEQRREWQRYWLIDPLDGTKEFIAQRDEFTVNIALIENHRAVLGVIHVPVSGESYYAVDGKGAFKKESREASAKPISVRKVKFENEIPQLTVVVSRHSGRSKVGDLLSKLDGQYEKASVGSSLKMCLVAEGKADFYPRLGPTSEWDTAAAQIIVEEAGGALWDLSFTPMQYNTKASLLNPSFLVVGDSDFEWKTWCNFES